MKSSCEFQTVQKGFIITPQTPSLSPNIHPERLTRKVAMDVPMIKPAMTSDQWFRYSATRFRPVRKARHMSPRDSTGLARRVPFACTVHVTYICRKSDARIIVLCIFYTFFVETFWCHCITHTAYIVPCESICCL